MKLSVIIPIYNGEKFIRKSIDSVLNQTVSDLELILVDDGSKDNSGKICDEYAQKDSRIKVIHKENVGVSAARNDGISTAQGEYIGFVDADDWIEPNMFEDLIEKAQASSSDIVMCDATTVYFDGRTEPDTITQLKGNILLNRDRFSSRLLLEMAGSAWRCIYSNSMIKKHDIKFPVGVKFSEDRIFNIYAMGYADKISYIKKPYYNRFINNKSAVHSFHEDYFEAYKLAAKEIEKAIAAAWNNDDEYQVAYLSQFISGALMAVNNYFYKTSTLKFKQRKQKVIELCEDKMLQEAIDHYTVKTKPMQWIRDKNIIMLIIYAKLANFKHKR